MKGNREGRARKLEVRVILIFSKLGSSARVHSGLLSLDQPSAERDSRPAPNWRADGEVGQWKR